MQPPAPLVPFPRLQQRGESGVRGGRARHVPLRTHVLLLVRRELARPRAVRAAKEVDQGVYSRTWITMQLTENFKFYIAT